MTALLLSFGKDSLVLLRQVLNAGHKPTLIHFYDHLDPYAEEMIKAWGLTVASYSPVIRYQVDDTVISEYAIGDARLPLLRDVSVDGKSVGTATTPTFNYDFTETLWGYRRGDRHSLVQQEFPKEFQLGPTKMVAPLWNWSDQQVRDAIDFPYREINEDVRPTELPKVSREVFQQRFGLGGI